MFRQSCCRNVQDSFLDCCSELHMSMNKYMIEIFLTPIPMDKVQELAGPEDAMVADWKAQGLVEQGYVRSDLSGAYIVMRADSPEQVQERMSKLPMFPYMKQTAIEIKDMI